MGHLKDIANQSKIQSFPSATFEIEGLVPASQCSQARIEGDHGSIVEFGSEIIDVGNFIGENLVGKWFTIISPPTDAPTQQIQNNTDDLVNGTQAIGADSDDTVYYIHDGGSLILTRNLQSFAAYISAAGYSYTIKGGKLYSNIPSENLALACRILFAPLT